MELSILHEYGNKIETYLKLNTFSLALKLLERKKTYLNIKKVFLDRK